MDIDVRTLSLMVAIANVLQAIAIAFLYANNKKYRGVGWWVLGSALNASGFAFLLLRDVSPVFITIILANSLIIMGSVFIYIGVLRFLDKRENLWLIIPIFVAYVVLYFIFTYLSDDINTRTIVLSLFLAYYSLLTASVLLREVPRSIVNSARFVVAAELFIAFFSLFRTAYIVLISPIDGIFSSAAIQIAAFLVFFIGEFILTFGLIIMVNQRLNEDVIEAKEEFELFFRTSPDGIVISYLDNGEIIDVNDGFTNLTGFNRDEAIGSSSLKMDVWKNPADRQEFFDEVLEKGLCENYETILKRKDGSEITCIVSAKSITLQGVPCIISVTRDITDRKRAEEALHQVNRKLNLLSSITRHDILNTVTVLSGYLGLALEKSVDPEMEEYLQKMDASAKKIQRQIEFTREYQEIGVDAAAWQNLRETVLEVASEFSMDDITLNIDCGNVGIFADPLLQKVFYNFFDNSFRYAPPFTAISVSCTENGDGLSVVFADDGAGITEDDRKHLFERGFGKNTGLGLFLSREILAITGITITENGGAEKGARFEMTVPKGAYRISGTGPE